MMNYLEFLGFAVENVKDYLPDEFRNADVRSIKVEKPMSEPYDGICFSPEGTNVGVCLNLEGIYESFDSASELSKIMKIVADDLLDAMGKSPCNFEQYTDDCDKFIENVNIQLVNARRNRKLLEKVPHAIYDDMAIIYKLVVKQSAGNSLATIVTNELMNHVGASQEEIHESAMKNLKIKNQVTVEKIKGNFYILPLSSEILALVKDDPGKSEAIRDLMFIGTRMLQDGLLSEAMYYCDREKRNITKVKHNVC